MDGARRILIKGLFGLAVLGPGVAGCSRRQPLSASPLGNDRLRPPGAVDEDDFTGRCIRCGRCMEVCPYHCIVPLDARAGLHAGTPLIDARANPCHLCMECVDVCPTGALQPVSREETRMGLAVIDTSICAAHQPDTLCRTCYSVCPLQNVAIELEDFIRPRVIDAACTGCGVCVQACPVEGASGRKAISVEPGR